MSIEQRLAEEYRSNTVGKNGFYVKMGDVSQKNYKFVKDVLNRYQNNKS